MSSRTLNGALWVFFLAVALYAEGCSNLAFDVESDRPEWSQSVAAKSQFRPGSDPGPSDIQAEPQLRKQALPGEYRLATDDRLEVGILSLEEPGKIKTLSRTVSLEGNITLPWVGALPVKDCTLRGAEECIAEAYSGRFIKDPQVTVDVVERHGAVVVVAGAVEKPGVYPLRHGHATVLDLLSAAGGVTRHAGHHVLLIRRSGDMPKAGKAAENDKNNQRESRKTIRIKLSELLSADNSKVDRMLTPGDIVTVPQKDPRFVSVMGYVGRPGAYELQESNRMSVLEAVAHAGGLTSSARPGNSYVLRKTTEGQETMPVDLSKVAQGEAPPLYLREGDVLLVGTSTASQVVEVIRPAARVSANATVSP